ncbi:MAG: M14 family metallopeptidase [Peptococcaceae bacterium]|nr:M14 family metallopeptidase [Peptococcaceae bacterium]
METLRTGSQGPLVELLQSALHRLNLYAENIDGIFGAMTANAVISFQNRHGLMADGSVGASTWYALCPYINGYDVHSITGGDTIFTLANAYRTTVERILTANPGINVYNLRAGQKIIVPLGAVVSTNISYSYDILKLNLDALKTIYPFLQIGTVGHSSLCQKIFYIRIGRGTKEVFYNASFHGNEWITTPVLMKFLETFALAYTNSSTIQGYSAREIFNNVSIYLVPMVNPDGVDLVTGGIRPGSAAYTDAEKIAANYPNIPFPRGWKANIEGIDLNLQFPAGWQNAQEIKFAQGYVSPAPRDYVGPEPLYASEARSVYNFTVNHDFRLIAAYHTQGKEIYWQFLDYAPDESLPIAQQFARVSGYAISDVPYTSSFAGYKDWFLQTYSRPGYTIEAGYGVNPLPINQFDEIYAENEGILVLGAVLS